MANFLDTQHVNQNRPKGVHHSTNWAQRRVTMNKATAVPSHEPNVI